MLAIFFVGEAARRKHSGMLDVLYLDLEGGKFRQAVNVGSVDFIVQAYHGDISGSGLGSDHCSKANIAIK